MSLADPLSGIPSDRTAVVVPLLELPATSLPRPAIAFARVPVRAANNIGIRMDGEYRTAYSGH